MGRRRSVAGYVTHRKSDDRNADRHVYQKYPTPSPIRDEQAAKNRTDHRAYRKDAAEEAYCAVAYLAKVIDDDPGRRRREAGSTGPLYRPQYDQHVDVAGEPAAQRSGREDSHGAEKYLAMAVLLAEISTDRQHQYEPERIARQGPSDPVDRSIQALFEGVQGRRDDRRVDRHHEQRPRDDRED